MELSPVSGGNLADPKGKKILIVDDDEGILELLEHVVKKEGFSVERAGDGNEAIQKVGASCPDLIVLDFMLPGIGGFEVLKELQSSDARAVPVIVITGRKIDRQTIELLLQESNVKQYFEKPVKTALLAGALHRFLGTQPPDVSRAPNRGPLSSGW